MKNEPKVTVLILSWNKKEETLECLASLQGLKYFNYELVVIDNGSTDGLGREVRKSFPGVKLIRNPQNLGFSQGNNAGVGYALKNKTDYICLLNNDTVADKDFLLSLIQVGQKEDRIGVLGSRVYFYRRPRTIWSEGIKVNAATGRVTTPLYRKPESEAGSEIREWDAVSGAAVLIKRSVIEEIGMLDADFFTYYEDVDWCLRARRHGYRVVTVPASRIWHKVSSTSMGANSPTVIYYLVRNQLLLINKNFPFPSQPRRRLRDLAIIAFNLAFLLTTPGIDRKQGLLAFRKGIRHYYQKKFGPR